MPAPLNAHSADAAAVAMSLSSVLLWPAAHQRQDSRPCQFILLLLEGMSKVTAQYTGTTEGDVRDSTCKFSKKAFPGWPDQHGHSMQRALQVLLDSLEASNQLNIPLCCLCKANACTCHI